ncbi:MAG: DUF1015 domain-containing protein [Rhodospirillales bacterium]|nr:DUF1015 domain-containing protein [Rhodospirillales bacterium]
MPLPLLRPFAALRPTRDYVAKVVAPPYDVLSSDEALVEVEGNPWSFLHISKAEIDLPPGTDHYAPAVYAKSAENLSNMIARGVIKRETRPCYYIYRLTMGEHVQTGVVGAASVAAYDSNRIRKHEYTRPDKEDDRVRQIDACNAQTGPVLLAHRPTSDLSAVIAEQVARPPRFDVEARDHVRHALWVVEDDAAIARITAAFDAMPNLYIADGHHRSAAASRVAAMRRAANPAPRGDEPYESFLVVSFPIEEMRILDYNRVVRDLGDMSCEDFRRRLEADFIVDAVDGRARPERPHEFGMYMRRRWYRLRLREGVPVDPVARLDVSMLTDRLLRPVLGISDLRKDARIDFVGGKRGLSELERQVDCGEAVVAFAMYPTRMEDLIAVAEAGEVMPPKSTWFEPKLGDGLVSYPLD